MRFSGAGTSRMRGSARRGPSRGRGGKSRRCRRARSSDPGSRWLPDAVTKTFRTSGTTGEGYGEHHFIDTQLYDAAILAGWDRLGLPRGAYLFLVPAPRDAPHSSLSHMMDVLGREAVAAAKVLASAAMGVLGSRSCAISSMRVLTDAARPGRAARHGARLPAAFRALRRGRRYVHPAAGSFAMETGGYKGSGRDIPKAELYAKFGQYLGLAADQVINEYGMTELSSQFYTRGLGQPHTAGPWLRALVIDPETGGEVAVGGDGRAADFRSRESRLGARDRDARPRDPPRTGFRAARARSRRAAAGLLPRRG